MLYVRSPYALVEIPADAPRELHVLGHDGDTLGVDGAQVGVLKQPDEKRLTGLLQREDRRRLEAKLRFEAHCDLANQALEGELPNEHLSLASRVCGSPEAANARSKG